jgi:hypothetical protein
MNSTHLPNLYLNQIPVRITKLSAHAGSQTPLLPTSYWVEGVLEAPIFVGQPIRLVRHRRPRWPDDPEGTPEVVARLGLFESSQIVRIEQNLLYTENSVWQIERVNPTPLTQP